MSIDGRQANKHKLKAALPPLWPSRFELLIRKVVMKSLRDPFCPSIFCNRDGIVRTDFQ